MKVVLVTGASQGIGLTIAKRFAEKDHTVVLNGRRADALAQAAAECAGFGVEVLQCVADIAVEADVQAMFQQIDERFGRLDVAVNNAGIALRVNGRKPDIEDTPLDLWERTMATNLTGTFLVCRSAVTLMKRHHYGRIINMSSQGARMFTGASASYYAASKAGVLGFSRVLAGEVGRYGITVNCVAPGRIATAMTRTLASQQTSEEAILARTPSGRIGRTNDVAAAVEYLASDDAGFTTGAILDVSGGFFMP